MFGEKLEKACLFFIIFILSMRLSVFKTEINFPGPKTFKNHKGIDFA